MLYPLCTGLSTRLQRFHDHVVRIYSPTFAAFKRIPELWTDGTAFRLGGQLYDRAVAGDGVVLGQKLIITGLEKGKKWLDGKGRGGDDSAGPQPPNQNGVPPPPQPPQMGPSPEAAPPAA